MSETRRRVKVYTLNEDRQWEDRGTGHVDTLKDTTLTVTAETDGNVNLVSVTRVIEVSATLKWRNVLHIMFMIVTSVDAVN